MIRQSCAALFQPFAARSHPIQNDGMSKTLCRRKHLSGSLGPRRKRIIADGHVRITSIHGQDAH